MDIPDELIREENRRIRMLRIVSDLLIQLLMSRRVSLAEANVMIRRVRTIALHLFPGKEQAFDLIYMPRFRRALREAGYYDFREFRVIEGGKAE
ncbi:MAG TPA: hypothetical protein VK463_01100 [Desulfomonilaceae bacterium]|nr:hypothetical protein [Desulfomonilaceae bacterium]